MAEQEQTETTNTTRQVRRGNGLFFLAVFAAIIFALSYKPQIDTIFCNAETLYPKPQVIMLGASWCSYCYKARKYFTDSEISYCEYDIEDNGEGEQMYADLSNNPLMPVGIPVLYIGDFKLSGFDQRSIEKALSISKRNSE